MAMRTISITLVALTSVAFALPALAQKDKDDKPGHGRGGPPGQAGPPPSLSSSGAHPAYVASDHDRNATYSYYRSEHAAGRCPPGLAKKDNGCLPPGQAKKRWEYGRPLPNDVYYEPLPPVLLGQLSPAPAGYQYVRVANDILMMAVGTRLIAGSVADLSSF
jgi:hypothetical protein